MHEDHSKEQYFFDTPTVVRLAAFVHQFERPLLVGCPMVAQHAWEEDGDVVPVLDVDERFSDLPGFLKWDIYRPQALGAVFRGEEWGAKGHIHTVTGVDIKTRGMAPFVPDLILIDPPFYKVRADQLFNAVRILTGGDVTTPLMIASNPAMSRAFVGTFAAFGLHPSGYRPSYVTVSDTVGIEFLSANVPQDNLALLTA